MRRVTIYLILAADFETVSGAVTKTDVWCSGYVEIGTDDVNIFLNIDDFFNKLFKLPSSTIYFHNLKFDGSFILDYFLIQQNWGCAYSINNDTLNFVSDKQMENKTIKYLMDDMGKLYSITLKNRNKIYRIYDSFKLLPVSLKKIGDDINVKYKKLNLECGYNCVTKRDTPLTENQYLYFKHDLLTLSEGLTHFFKIGGCDKLTIGACCVDFYMKHNKYRDIFQSVFPDLTKFNMPISDMNVDKFVRLAYKGGYCYVNPKIQGKKCHNGLTIDANSMYPSVLHSNSGFRYPIDRPLYFFIERLPELRPEETFIIHIQTKFKIKNGYLPTIQIKNSLLFRENEYLTTSDLKINGVIHSKFIGDDGKKHGITVDLYLTQPDYELFHKHYHVFTEKIVEGVVFRTATGICDEYIEHFYNLKKTATGGAREIYKLFLNNLTGKFGTSPVNRYKIWNGVGNTLTFQSVPGADKKTFYVPVVAYITSYARKTLLDLAQQYYDYYCYSDSDSLHLRNIREEQINTKINNELGGWKIENKWETGVFIKQKSYIEIGDDITLKCAGMGERVKQMLIGKLTNKLFSELEIVDDDLEYWYNMTNLKLDDIKIGFSAPGNLKLKMVQGGYILTNSPFTLR